MKEIILASKSPRRHELLEMVGLKHKVITADCDENIISDGPADMVRQLSLVKAESVAETLKEKGPLVIGSDTIVYYEGEILGKPKDEEDALRMLTMLSGKIHSVFTGVTVIDTENGKKDTFYEETRVSFYEIPEVELREYIASGEPMDKAGSYGVQGKGAFLVKAIEGDYYTVVGLPVAHLVRLLKDHGYLNHS